jgi:signal transduction histidine kinase
LVLAAAGLVPLALPELAWVHDSGAWSVGMLLGLGPASALIVSGIVRELRRHQGRERVRLQMLAGALFVGIGSVSTDLAAMAGLPVPRLSYAGLLLSSLLVAAIVLEARIIEGVRVATVVNALLVAMLAVVGQVVVLGWAGDRSALVFFGTVVVIALSVAALVPLLRSLAENRARTEHLVTLGRFAQQMAHDIRNPLAAIKGAAQFLEQERADGRSIDEQGEMLAIISERVDRIERFIADYQRMGRVEPVLSTVEPNRVADAALHAAAGVSKGHVEVVKAFAPDAPTLLGDPDLLVFALENLVRNACEAMPEGGTLTVSTASAGERAGRPGVQIAVKDTGLGMDVRTRERALGGLYTTKASGSGLGLTFVRRVVEAHQGALSVASEEGRGTTVTLELPIGATVKGTPPGHA